MLRIQGTVIMIFEDEELPNKAMQEREQSGDITCKPALSLSARERSARDWASAVRIRHGPRTSSVPTPSSHPSTPHSPASNLLQQMAQVIVVGGGLAGLSAAHTLLERGASVLMLDKQP